MLNLISFLIVIAICVISHEGGHFAAAKWRNVLVHEFSFGMGPNLFRKKIGETSWSLRAFPIGGFVKLEGEDETETELRPENYDPLRSLGHKKPWERLIIIAAGAAVNLLLAWLLTAAYLSGYGVYDLNRPVIGTIIQRTPAQKSSLLPGDLIISINGIKLHKWEDISNNIRNTRNKNGDFVIVYKRNGKQNTTSLNIPIDKEYKVRLLGIRPRLTTYPIYKSLSESFSYSWQASLAILKALVTLITGKVHTEITGPVGIAVMAGDAFRSGFWAFIGFLGIINLNLGLLNLLPFPALDGGRIFFILIEMLTKHKVPEKWEAYIHYCGFIILVMLIVYVTGKDIMHLMQH